MRIRGSPDIWARRLGGLAAFVLLAGSGILAHDQAEPSPGPPLVPARSREGPTPPSASSLAFGAGFQRVQLLEHEGLRPTYVQLWAGPWLDRSGWRGFDEALRASRDGGFTPVIQFYYWGTT